MFDRLRVNRRVFLQTLAAGVAAPAAPSAQTVSRELLDNGVRLPSPWPPRRVAPSGAVERPPYLASPPSVINIATGRQLFVDDFLIEQSALHRTFHRAVYHPGNPVLTPERAWEIRDPHAINTGIQPSQSAMVFSDGVFFDPRDQLFKMWYMAGYQQATALALSRDGISWHRPNLDVVTGTNIVWPHRRDSSTVWLDLDAPPRSRFKMAAYDFPAGALRLCESGDGVHWREVGMSGPCADRSTMFRNPFRRLWVFSLRADDEKGVRRYRRYVESREFSSARWAPDEPVSWVAADRLDRPRAEFNTPPELYNLDAVAYESVMLGLFTIFRGERRDREKPNDVCVAFSRDGFHWDRSAREPFITVSETPGAWNWGNVQSAGGCCLIVNDRLYFYVSGRQGIPGTDLPGRCSTGLATLRRDGFASLSDEWPPGQPRQIHADRSSVVTRPLRFRGGHLFVNANVAGELRAEILDGNGKAIPAFSAAQCIPVRGDSTRHVVRWNTGMPLADLASEVVRVRFVLSRARLYSFWIADSPAGHSRGYVAAGGPGFASTADSA